VDWKKYIYEFGNDVELNFDLLKIKLREKLGFRLSIQVIPYITYGTSEEIYIRGRVMHDRMIISDEKDTILENVVNMYKRVASVEIEGAKLVVKYNNTEQEFFSDEDGYFEFPLKLNTSLPKEQLWHNPVLELLECKVNFEKPLIRHARVMTPPSTAQFGIISDIDDTIIPSHAQEIFKMAYHTITKNQFSRLPFDGVAYFYRKLQGGISGENFNPFFYVSSSPWNLYDLLLDFIKVNDIPSGPLLLKDYGFTHNKIVSESHGIHKPKMIRNILNTYPDLKFILIGDSGQKDPEIYLEAVEEFPERILAIYIRDVSAKKRDDHIGTIVEKLKAYNVEMILCEDTSVAIEHAGIKGFIKKVFNT
jgi:phosphatidate phosphatase APP1